MPVGVSPSQVPPACSSRGARKGASPDQRRGGVEGRPKNSSRLAAMTRGKPGNCRTAAMRVHMRSVRENLSRVQDAMRVEQLLQPFLKRDQRLALLHHDEVLLGDAHAMLA